MDDAQLIRSTLAWVPWGGVSQLSRRIWLIALLLLVAVVAAFAGGLAGVAMERENTEHAEQALRAAEDEWRWLGASWQFQAQAWVIPEPAADATGGGMFMGRIVGFDASTSAITFDWIGNSTPGGMRTDRVDHQQVMQVRGVSSFVVQEPNDGSGVDPTPRSVAGREFFTELGDNGRLDSRFSDAHWLVFTLSDDHFGHLYQLPPDE